MAGNIIHDGNLGRVWNRIKNLFVQKNEVGVADGVASLDSYGKIPLSQLPSTADDVIEGYYYNDVFYEDSEHTIPITGETGKIYIDITDGENKIYRYTSNDGYISITSGAVQSDWEEDDSSSQAHVLNRPAIRKGTGTNSIIEGELSGNVANTASGLNSHAEGLKTTASAPRAHSEGYNTSATKSDAHAEGNASKADGSASHAEGFGTQANADYSHAECYSTKTTAAYSHAEGNSTTASGQASHAEGSSTTASGLSSHAEGSSTTASANCAHAEGTGTEAKEWCSHAEGNATSASGYYSHAEGLGTIAKGRSNHVFGEYNISDSGYGGQNKGTYIEIVGNGTSTSNRKNARTLDWSGNEVLSGNLTVNGTTLTVNGQQIEPQVQADWNQTTTTAKDYIKNKPTIPTQTSNLINDGEGGSSGSFVTSDELATIATSGNFSDLEGATSSDEGKILSVNSQGEFNLINCDEPLTSQEIDNILT